MFELTALGWSPSRHEEFEPYAAGGLAPARVAAQHRGAYVVYTESGERPAEVEVEPGGAMVWEVSPQNPFAVFGGLGG